MGSQTSYDGTRTTRRYVAATLGSRSERGGIVVAARESPEGVYIGKHKVACVGDLVHYPDGSESPIVSGAGEAHVINGKPVALVGSHVANGDRIASSLQSADEILIKPTDEMPRGLLEPGYEPSGIGSCA